MDNEELRSRERPLKGFFGSRNKDNLFVKPIKHQEGPTQAVRGEKHQNAQEGQLLLGFRVHFISGV